MSPLVEGKQSTGTAAIIAWVSSQRNEARARSVIRWMALGLTRDEARKLWEDDSIGTPPINLIPTPEKQLKIIKGEMGVGKSLVGDRMFARFLAGFEQNPTVSPIPIYLETRPAPSQLQKTLVDLASVIGDYSKQGFVAIVDDKTNADSASIYQLIDESRFIVELFPEARIVLLTRPFAISGENITELETLPALSEEEAILLVESLAGPLGSYGLSTFPPVIHQAAFHPLFAILLAQALKSGATDRAFQSKGDLFHSLVSRALNSVTRRGQDSSHLQSALQHLAVSVLKRGGPVPFNEAFNVPEQAALIDSLIQTGFVKQENKSLSFILDALLAWFASASLQQGIPKAENFKSYDLYGPWNDALKLFLTQSTYLQTSPYLKVIVESDVAGAAGLVSSSIDEATHRIVGQPSTTAPDWEDSGRRLREAMDSWVKALGPTASLLIPLRADGTPTSLGVRVDNGVLAICWAKQRTLDTRSKDAVEPTEDLILLPEEFNSFRSLMNTPRNLISDWQNVKWVHVGTCSSWAWRLTLNQLRDSLKTCVGKRRVPLDKGNLRDGALWREYTWYAMLASVGIGSYSSNPVPLDRIQIELDAASNYGDNVFYRSGDEHYPLSAVRSEFERLKSSEATEWLPPYPGPDEYSQNGWYIDPETRVKTKPVSFVSIGSGWWNNFSDQGLANVAGKIFEAALEGYQQIVATYFPDFSSRLATFVMLPARVVVLVEHPWHHKNWGPSVTYYFEPLPVGQKSYVDARPVQNVDKIDFDFIDGLRSRRDAMRPPIVRSLPVSLRSSAECFSPRAAEKAVYEWLTSDLRAINWIE